VGSNPTLSSRKARILRDFLIPEAQRARILESVKYGICNPSATLKISPPVLADCDHQRVVELCRGGFLETRQNVGVEVEGNGDRRVAENVLVHG
jgi:hypothetical protein